MQMFAHRMRALHCSFDVARIGRGPNVVAYAKHVFSDQLPKPIAFGDDRLTSCLCLLSTKWEGCSPSLATHVNGLPTIPLAQFFSQLDEHSKHLVSGCATQVAFFLRPVSDSPLVILLRHGLILKTRLRKVHRTYQYPALSPTMDLHLLFWTGERATGLARHELYDGVFRTSCRKRELKCVFKGHHQGKKRCNGFETASLVVIPQRLADPCHRFRTAGVQPLQRARMPLRKPCHVLRQNDDVVTPEDVFVR
mmetsp:Transcript_25944/g.50485  ORF Transcript_25944/g.50485 Transcript_25944/m.50485 type:complete len:251 (-) Transcript_25944:209-961(-)